MDTSYFADNYMIYFTIGTFLSGIAHLIMLIAAIILVSKIKKPATYLILLGVIFEIIVMILGTIMPYFSRGSENMITLQGINSILAGLSVLIFALGLILLSSQLIKENAKH